MRSQFFYGIFHGTYIQTVVRVGVKGLDLSYDEDMSKDGFTLIELTVVMAIIGILAVLSFGSYQNSQIRARDAQRKSDLKQIGISLESYYGDKKQYPASSADHKLNGCADEVTCDWGDEWSDEHGTIYMIELPSDSRTGLNYYYLSDGTYYQIYARLENNLDNDVPTLNGNPANYSISCGDYNCNYGLSSSNIAVGQGRTPAEDP